MAKTRKETNWNLATTDVSHLLQIYYREISRFPLLTAEEERKLARSMAKGIDGARQRLIISNLRLVVKIAQGYADSGVDLIDLIQEGNLGLIEAIDRFDVERGYRLSTYATWWVRRAILSAITEYSRMIRIPDYLFRALRRLKQIRDLSQGKVEANEQEITTITGLSVERLQQIERRVRDLRSLDQLVGASGEETLEEVLEDTTTPAPEREALRLLFQEELRDIIDYIPARQASALRLHYGLEDGIPYSLAEVGKVMEISRERARQLVQEGLVKVTAKWSYRSLEYFRNLLLE